MQPGEQVAIEQAKLPGLIAGAQRVAGLDVVVGEQQRQAGQGPQAREQ